MQEKSLQLNRNWQEIIEEKDMENNSAKIAMQCTSEITFCSNIKILQAHSKAEVR